MNELIPVAINNKTINTDEVDQLYRDDIALLIPRVAGQPYIKSTTEAAVNTMWKMTAAMRPNKSKISFDQLHTGKTDEEVHEDLMALVKDMSNLMQKIVHSSSWRNGEFNDFDKVEFDRLLRNMQYHTSAKPAVSSY
ncbi:MULTISPECIES: hypothetical protein [Bacillus]|nr:MULTISPECIES: hypothetical protein [Bacillus]MEC3432573.1 hypothetical protein [Bacillus cereus]RCX38696.1 hypothetical protein DEU45_106206 [Bacillus sp. AG102]AFQ30278.1 hypothetical protein BTF1_30887 [Bacillus thuringiensis HD-789]AJH02472.1 hypothetical protein AS86_6513 [Bacillus thuringiensis HD1002]AND28469.1 hypothetical protein ATN07_32590 [Bacillus thuringiensis serovar israelensis]